jgi:malto-oligosyltrehalose synthase
LEKGRHSAYASFFDVDWNSPVYEGKLMAPFLGSSLEDAVQNGQLQLIIEEGRISFKCYDSFYPSNEVVYQLVLNNLPEQLAQVAIDEKEYVQRFDDLKRSFSFLIRKNDTKHAIENILQAVNNNKEQLLQLLHQQHYQLCHWQETDRQINYRRFFTVNGLICLNMQEEHVFQYFHQLIKQMIDEGFWKGLRIDHVDGLFDPTQYLERLKNSAGENLYVTVEKILQPGESIPANWKVQGNTGYDFLAITNNLFTNRQNEKLLTDFYSSLVPGNNNFTQQLADKKSYILYHHMSGELENLFQLFLSQNLLDEEVQEIISKEDLKKAIGLFLIYCPVYRYYGNALPLQDQEAKAIGDIMDQIKQEEPALIRALDILSAVLLKKPVEGNDDYNQRALKFYQRCMQFSGPRMAKGFEDTLMYTFNRFIVHNEVGDSPNAFGYNMDQFHQKMKDRQKQWPLYINTCSTHDTKMGEDVRARLNVLSDIAPLVLQQVKEWMGLNKELKKENGPDVNDEYFIYQALCGHYPMPGQAEDNFKDRLQEYLQKALREAKTHSNWTTPNEEYELATKTFAVKLLDKDKPFWKSFEKFQNLIVDFGIINSLVQVLLKCTCPGIPDIYQGTELWNLDFVDPDNRRPVDYEKRAIFLNELETNKDKNTVFQKIWQQRYSGKIKLWLTHRLLQLREQETSLFSKGEYMPLAIKGKYKENIIAFARTYRQTVFIIVAPLHIASLCMQQKKQWQDLDWKNTKISLPGNMLPVGESVFQSQKISLVGSVSIKTILQDIPFAVLKGEIIPNERGAGVLLHISSLPSPFGIGDMGPEAVAFADFLYCSYQKFWQLLPLNPTEEEQRHSPYSSTSAKAGNTLLISPELLADDGFLNSDELRAFHLPQTGKTDYHATEEVKKKLFAKAWTNFKNSESAAQKEFHDFCDKEKSWLDNFALYMILKEEHEGKPWY